MTTYVNNTDKFGQKNLLFDIMQQGKCNCIIGKDETKIIGHWVFIGSKTVADEACMRIDYLRSNYLKLITTDESGWLNLYQDPLDNRYWQLNFEHREMQGGGPPSLIFITELEAKSKYGL